MVAKRWWCRWLRRQSLIGYTTSAASKRNGDGWRGDEEETRGVADWGFKVRRCPTSSEHPHIRQMICKVCHRWDVAIKLRF